MFRSSFSKCTSLWNKASRSTVAADHVHEISRRKLLVPSPTRWNSYYDALSWLTEIFLPDLNELCNRINLRHFTDREISFLKEYCIALKPLAMGLDILQGDDNCYYGFLLPTLETIMRETSLKPNLSNMTTGIVDAIQASIETRFKNVFESRNAILATVTLPNFKLRWVNSQAEKDTFKRMLIQEMRLHCSQGTASPRVSDAESQESRNTSGNTSTAKGQNFFEFEDNDVSNNSVENECSDFLNNAKTLECLHRYPKIKSVFLKYNTTIPSSAPVERLFSLESIILTPKRNRLTDARFERLLLMHYSKDTFDF